MSKDQKQEPIDCVAFAIVRNTGEFGGYVKHKLRLTQADLDRLSVEASEPEIVGVVAGLTQNEIFRWVDR